MKKSRVVRAALSVTLGVALILFLILHSFGQFSRQIFDDTFRSNEGRLIESAAQNTDIFRTELYSAVAYIKSLAVTFSLVDDITSESSLAMFNRILTLSRFNRLWLVTPDGVAHDSRGRTMNIATRDFYWAMVQGKSGISERLESLFNRQPVLCVYSPIPGGKGGIVGVFEVPSLAIRTQSNLFGGEGYTHIFRLDGQFVIKATSIANTISENNIFDYLRKVEYDEGFAYDNVSLREQYSFDKLLGKFRNWDRGIFFFRDGSKRYMAYFESCGMNGWNSITVIPEAVVNKDSTVIDDRAFVLIMKMLALFAALTLGIVYLAHKSRQAILHANRLLDINNQRFRIAAFHLSNDVVEFDVLNNRLYRVNDAGVTEAESSRPIPDVASGLIRNQKIDDQYLSVLESSMQEIRRGKPFESCVVKTRRTDGERGWYKVVFTSIRDEDKRPVKAVGTIEDITAQRDTEIRFQLEERQRRAMMSEVMDTMVFNVTKERYLYSHDGNDQQSRLLASLDYKQELEARLAEKVHPDFRAEVMEKLAPRRLRQLFTEGDVKVELECRAVDAPDGGERWLNCLVNLVVDPEANDLMGYVYLRDITRTKLDELELKKGAELDALTGLYNRGTTTRLITEFLQTPGAAADGTSAFLLIDLDHFKHVNDFYGHGAGDRVLVGLAAQLQRNLRSTDIIGRMGGDEFVAFVKGAKNVDMISRKAADICASLKDIRFDADMECVVSGSVGICLVPPEGTDFLTLYEKADRALYTAKNEGKDRFKFYDRTMRHQSERRERPDLQKPPAKNE